MSIKEKINEFATKYDEGFTNTEIDELLEQFPEIDLEKFEVALIGVTGVTGVTVNGEPLVYAHDLEIAIRAGLNKNINQWEWD